MGTRQPWFAEQLGSSSGVGQAPVDFNRALPGL